MNETINHSLTDALSTRKHIMTQKKKTAARRYENGKTPKEKKAILPGQEASTAADDLPTAEITTNETSK